MILWKLLIIILAVWSLAMTNEVRKLHIKQKLWIDIIRLEGETLNDHIESQIEHNELMLDEIRDILDYIGATNERN